jgi:hypothetical protein
MMMKNRTLVLVVATVLWMGPSVLAQPAEPASAPAAATAAVPAGDTVEMLARCDARLERCLEHRAGMPYLAIAYMVLWVILLVFLLSARRSQRRLGQEIDTLREQLRELEGSR